MTRDVYIAIMVAAENGRGLSLTAQEVTDLSLDDAISQAAFNRLSADEHAKVWDSAGRAWAKIRPGAPREAANAASIIRGDRS